VISSVRDLIVAHEGYTNPAKPDDKGKWVIGFGHDIPAPSDPNNPPSCTAAEAANWLSTDISLATARAMACVGVSTWLTLSEVRRAVLTDLAFQLGGSGLAQFQKMLGHIRAAEWDGAAAELLNSAEAHQTPGRAQMNASMLRTGLWPR
jgi:GH24 family phage-related lysozyme (muramidase)